MQVEILFHTLGRLVIEVETVYTSDQTLCIQLPDGYIRHFPLMNIWSWTYIHGNHWGTTQNKSKRT